MSFSSVAGCLAGLGFCLCGPMLTVTAAEPAVRYERTEPHMGVPFRIVLYANTEAAANQAFDAAFARIAELNAVMSDYDAESELMRLCKSSRPGLPVEVSPPLFEVLQRAKRMSEASGGAFDVTVGPAVQLWRRARRQREFPDPERLADARARIGDELVRLDTEHRTVELLRDGMRLDLGGIAKGYAVDEAMKILKTHGIGSALIDGSGDILVSAAPPNTDGWVVGVAALKTPSAAPTELLTIQHLAIATSGDAYQYVEFDGVRYSHLIDPRTGLGLTIPSSVTVIAHSCTDADAWASALSVLPPEGGFAVIAPRTDLAALIVRNSPASGITTHRSPRFPTPCGR